VKEKGARISEKNFVPVSGPKSLYFKAIPSEKTKLAPLISPPRR